MCSALCTWKKNLTILDLYVEDEIELRKAAELKILLQNNYNLQIDLVLKSKEKQVNYVLCKKDMKYIYANQRRLYHCFKHASKHWESILFYKYF